ncbi:hypothetical protein [Reinekea thalattae]|uniref:Uncharacterized protein n=1 Tax=Reinekea thalattae TaxID=2593301 RepID=A0A5C8Z878_9GAMM|nr:hypothetical protein [Reinekea thalattae]TXR53857.1 hypothetical protein FME95_04685 [Reinekea thalattae]
MKPDYYKYSEFQLREVLKVIDRKAHPDRVAEIENILSDEKLLARSKQIQKEQESQRLEQNKETEAYIAMILPFTYGLILVFAGITIGRGGMEHTISNPYLRYGAGGGLLLLGIFQAVKIILSQRKK